ncbi:MAG: TatD family hydrolase [Acidobacteria bacterium]|nr:TatD family hydrolase [Acidobacteriota bacterium]MCB9378036.1 TatD family hydrolase [Holophagales bacterium]
MLVDSHCHLQSLPAEERAAALDRARARGVEGFLVPGIRLDEAEEILRLCEAEAGVWCALGVHPHEAASWRDGDVERLRELLTHPKAVAVGECGLDFYYDHAPHETQERVLLEQLRLAVELGLPAVIHNRESSAEMTRLLCRPELARLVCDLHSFAGGAEMARELVPRGHYFGVSGMVTFPKADNVRSVLPEIPRERLLVETDTPYLAPVPHRGQRNEPAYVVEVAERLAVEVGLERSELERSSTEAFFRLFSKARLPDPEFDSGARPR